MTSAQRTAHLRLLEQLRDSTRTHQCDYTTHQRGIRHSTQDRELLLDRLRKMEAAGVRRNVMVRECNTSVKTILRLLGKKGKRK